jgi:hypothetical protein
VVVAKVFGRGGTIGGRVEIEAGAEDDVDATYPERIIASRKVDGANE